MGDGVSVAASSLALPDASSAESKSGGASAEVVEPYPNDKDVREAMKARREAASRLRELTKREKELVARARERAAKKG